MWTIVLEDAFSRDYRHLHSEIQKRVDDGINYLQNAPDPAKCGEPKKGRWKGFRSYEIGRQYRMLYKVDQNEKALIFARVGLHSIY